MEYPIEDARDASFFKLTTFSKYKRTDVKRELLTSLVESQLEPCCYWTTELVCSGNFADLWETILFYFGKYVHAANPKLAVYIDVRFSTFKDVAKTEPLELELRNKVVIRQLFAEIICVLCLSPKKLGCDAVKVKKEELDKPQARFKATTADFGRRYFKGGDPMELYPVINEIAYSLSADRMMDACYWLEWLMLYDATKKPPPRCIPRDYVQGKRQASEIIWIVWDVLLAYAKDKGALTEKIALATSRLFCLHYTPAANERRRFLLYFVVALICEDMKLDADMVADRKVIDAVFPKCSLMYRDIRKHSIKLKPTS
jgi:hypothetical protein